MHPVIRVVEFVHHVAGCRRAPARRPTRYNQDFQPVERKRPAMSGPLDTSTADDTNNFSHPGYRFPSLSSSSSSSSPR